jgi:hypothetical protein
VAVAGVAVILELGNIPAVLAEQAVNETGILHLGIV